MSRTPNYSDLSSLSRFHITNVVPLECIKTPTCFRGEPFKAFPIARCHQE